MEIVFLWPNQLTTKTAGDRIKTATKKMKKMLLGLVFLLTVGLFAEKNVQASIDSSGNEKISTLTIDVKGTPEAYVYDVTYGSNGTIKVQVRVRDSGGRSYRVKVTPTNQIKGVVVEGALYCTVESNNNPGYVTFNCKAGKEGEAEYCAAYTFNAEIVN